MVRVRSSWSFSSILLFVVEGAVIAGEGGRVLVVGFCV